VSVLASIRGFDIQAECPRCGAPVKLRSWLLPLACAGALGFILIQLRVIDLTRVFQTIGMQDNWGEAGILLLLCAAVLILSRRIA
jgi:hypothetical protein